MTTTSIEWTDKTWNPVRGCTKTSPGCTNCYAMHVAARFNGPGQPYEGLAKRDPTNWTGAIRLVPEKLAEPLTWKKPCRVFVNSMSDLFHEDVPETFIEAVFGIMALAEHHTFQVLTKRAARMADVVSRLTLDRCLAEVCMIRKPQLKGDQLVRHWSGRPDWPLPNVHLGTSVEDQARADERIPHLLRTPAAVRFLSVEPLLEAVQLDRVRWQLPDSIGVVCGSVLGDTDGCEFSPRGASGRGVDWVIVGGESGHGARPCDVDWIRSVVDQCREAGVSCFVKQLGANLRHYDERCWRCGYADWGCFDRRPGDEPPYKNCNVCGADSTRCRDAKGGDINWFPEDLRIRQFPTPRAEVTTP